MMPPSAAGTPPCAFAASTGAMNAKLEPVYDGTRLRVTRLKTIVPMPDQKIVAVTGNPVSTGTERRRAEHREDVLRRRARASAAWQPLVRPHDRARLDCPPVPVKLPHRSHLSPSS